MIKQLILPSLAALTLLSACSKDEPNQLNNVSYTYATNNLVIPTSPSIGNPAVCQGSYVVTFKYGIGGVSVTTPGILINSQTVAFTSADFPFEAQLKGTVFSGGTASANGQSISSINGWAPSGVYMVAGTTVPGYPVNEPVVRSPLVLSYNYGSDYTVKTFPSDAFYSGTTQTSYMTQSGQPGAYSSNTIIYRVKFSSDLKKADVIIYDAKFAEEQPMAITAMVLQDLNVDYTSTGYTIYSTPGQNVVPKIPEGGILVENQMFPFTQFTLQTSSSDLVTVTAAFKVGSRYMGSFTGSYAYTGN